MLRIAAMSMTMKHPTIAENIVAHRSKKCPECRIAWSSGRSGNVKASASRVTNTAANAPASCAINPPNVLRLASSAKVQLVRASVGEVMT